MKKKPIIEKEEIEKAIRDRSLAFNKNRVEIVENFNKAVAALQIEGLMGQIIQSKGVLFSISGQTGYLTVAYNIQNDSIYVQLNNFCESPNLIEDISLSFPTIISRPDISLFIRTLREIFSRHIDMEASDNHDEFVTSRIDLINEIVESIRTGVKSNALPKN